MHSDRHITTLTSYFSQFISEHKKEFMERVLDNRTRFVSIVLEDIFQSQNASAVIRTCECLGLQDIHIIETRSSWGTNKLVLRGSDKWINIHRYKTKGANNIGDCYELLKQKGYRIAVTDPSPDGVAIDELPIDQPIAIVMGNERHGTSDYAVQHADMKVHIPMVGFTESLNISVSAAICLHSLLTRLRNSPVDWKLSSTEKDLLRLHWYKKAVRRSELLEREFLKTIE
ncbi:MAG: RNA methyltransferase [Cyclobacteriaceae bacterium]|nr:RNA methyltransferase [Cyclobacteriaceae bacterium]